MEEARDSVSTEDWSVLTPSLTLIIRSGLVYLREARFVAKITNLPSRRESRHCPLAYKLFKIQLEYN